MRRMITFDEDHIRFTNRIVGVAFDRDRVLLHRTDDMNFWALPGGRAELLEPSPQTLVREMQEEIGVEVQVDRLLWVAENFFDYGPRSVSRDRLLFPDAPAARFAAARSNRRLSGRKATCAFTLNGIPVATLERSDLYPTFLRTGLKNLPDLRRCTSFTATAKRKALSP